MQEKKKQFKGSHSALLKSGRMPSYTLSNGDMPDQLSPLGVLIAEHDIMWHGIYPFGHPGSAFQALLLSSFLSALWGQHGKKTNP